MKFFLEKKGYGKYSHYVVKSASGKKLKELERRGEHLFNSRPEAYAEARSRKND